MAVVGFVGCTMAAAVVAGVLSAGLVAQPLLEGLIDNGPVTGLLWGCSHGGESTGLRLPLCCHSLVKER